MTTAKIGDIVNIKCEIKLEDGFLCFKNEEENPLEFKIGEGNFIPKIESTIMEMEEGETKTINLEPEEAFGPYIDDLIVEIPKDFFHTKEGINIGVDSKVKINSPSGKTYYGVVTEVTENGMKLNLNHPLAGKKILITLTLESITKEEPVPEKKSMFQFKKAKKKSPKKKPIKTKTSKKSKKSSNPSKTK
jgi:FKBP-type peptidyl-prolyl cis-trans isomerase 2